MCSIILPLTAQLSMSVKEACQAVANPTFPPVRSSVLGWDGFLSRATKAFIDTRQLYRLQGVPNPELLPPQAGVGMLLSRGEMTWTFDFGVLSSPWSSIEPVISFGGIRTRRFYMVSQEFGRTSCRGTSQGEAIATTYCPVLGQQVVWTGCGGVSKCQECCGLAVESKYRLFSQSCV